MTKKQILIIEDEEDILALLHYNLSKNNYDVISTTSGKEGLKLATTESTDLIILDLMLPEIGGIDICKELRRQDETSQVPIIMLTAKGEEADIVAGLESGADDYVTKPFSTNVLLARISTVLRRVPTTSENEYFEIHNLMVNVGKNEVTIDDNPVDLTRTEFLLLKLLVSHPGWVYTRSQIMDAVRGEDYAVTERAVDVQVVGLRKKLGTKGELIETVRGVGYRMKDAK